MVAFPKSRGEHPLSIMRPRHLALARLRPGVYTAYHVPLDFSEVFMPEGEGEAQETGAAAQTLAEAGGSRPT